MPRSKVVTHSDVPALAGAGWLGHTWVCTQIHDGRETMGLQSCDGPSCAKYVDEMGDRAGRIFKRTKKGWQEVSRSAASIA